MFAGFVRVVMESGRVDFRMCWAVYYPHAVHCWMLCANTAERNGGDTGIEMVDPVLREATSFTNTGVSVELQNCRIAR